MSIVKKRGKYPPRFIAGCDTGSINFLIAFLDIITFDCYLFKHNFKVNNPEFKSGTIQQSIYDEVLEEHKPFFDRTLFFTIETNHYRIRKEVAEVFTVLKALLKGRYSDMPQHVMTGKEVRSSYKIPPNDSHRARKDMSGDSDILSYDQTVLLFRAFDGKIDDAQDAINLIFAAYRKFFLSQEGIRPGEWKKIKVGDILRHKRLALQAQEQILKRLRLEKQTVDLLDDEEECSPNTEKVQEMRKRNENLNLPPITKKKNVPIIKKKKSGPVCRFAGHKKKRR